MTPTFFASGAGGRNDRLDPQLYLLARPDDARIDRADRLFPEAALVVGVEKLNSTSGVKRLTHSGRPGSRTWERQ